MNLLSVPLHATKALMGTIESKHTHPSEKVSGVNRRYSEVAPGYSLGRIGVLILSRVPATRALQGRHQSLKVRSL